MPPKIWNPDDYDQQCVLQYNTAMIMLDSFPFIGNEKVLDIGCGTGKISHQIAYNRVPGGEVIGLDINDKMIKFAQGHYHATNLLFECNDILFTHHENSFDLAVSFWTLSWISIKDQLTAINNIIRSLKENGQLLLMYPLKHDAYEVVNQVINKPEWQKYFVDYTMPRAFITEEQYNDIIREIPMKISIVKKEIECRYKDDNEMRSSINCWLAHVDEIPQEEDKIKFLSEVANEYKKHRGINQPIMYYSTLEITGNRNTLEHQPILNL